MTEIRTLEDRLNDIELISGRVGIMEKIQADMAKNIQDYREVAEMVFKVEQRVQLLELAVANLGQDVLQNGGWDK